MTSVLVLASCIALLTVCVLLAHQAERNLRAELDVAMGELDEVRRTLAAREGESAIAAAKRLRWVLTSRRGQ